MQPQKKKGNLRGGKREAQECKGNGGRRGGNLPPERAAFLGREERSTVGQKSRMAVAGCDPKKKMTEATVCRHLDKLDKLDVERAAQKTVGQLGHVGQPYGDKGLQPSHSENANGTSGTGERIVCRAWNVSRNSKKSWAGVVVTYNLLCVLLFCETPESIEQNFQGRVS